MLLQSRSAGVVKFVLSAVFAFSWGLVVACPSEAALVSYWPFDENGGSTAFDSGPGGNHGSIVNATFNPGQVGTALAFNNTNTRVDIGTPANLTFEYNQPFTLTAWINGPPGQGTGAILGKLLHSAPYRGYELNMSHSTNVNGPDRANLWMINTWTSPVLQVDSSVVVLDNTWHHLAVTSDGTGTGAGVKFYIDGVLDTGAVASKNDLAGNTILAAGQVTIGARNAQNDVQNFNGLIDEVAIFNQVLGASEVARLAAGTDTPLTLLVPEPSTFLLLGLGIAGLVHGTRRRRRR